MAQQELMVMRGTSKATGQRVWAVQSTSGSKAAGCPVFHILHWDEASASWVCPCPARKPCVHMRLASEASKADVERDAALLAEIEQEDSWQRFPSVDAMFDALTGPCPDYDDSNPRRDELEVVMKAEPIAVIDQPQPPVTIESTIARMSYEDAYKMWDGANKMFWTGRMEQKHYEAICAAARARMDELGHPQEPIIVRHDTGPRLFRGLPERVKEEM